MADSRRNKRILVAVLLLILCGFGAKLYLTVAHNVRQVSLSMRLGGAIIQGDLPQMEAVLKEGADPNEGDLSDTLLMATERGDKQMVQLLLKYGANPSKSLLRAGYRSGDAAGVAEAKAMLELGADVNARVGDSGDTPLMSHATSGNVEIVKFLLQRGADATLKSQREAQSGETILELVDYAARNHPEMAAQYQAVTTMLKQAIARQSTARTV